MKTKVQRPEVEINDNRKRATPFGIERIFPYVRV